MAPVVRGFNFVNISITDDAPVIPPVDFLLCSVFFPIVVFRQQILFTPFKDLILPPQYREPIGRFHKQLCL